MGEGGLTKNTDMKKLLDMEWNRKGVRCTMHFTRWHDPFATPNASGWVSETTGLIYSRGKKAQLKIKRLTFR